MAVARPDVIVADIMMPVMDGYEFVKRLRDTPGEGDRVAGGGFGFAVAFLLEVPGHRGKAVAHRTIIMNQTRCR